MSPSRTVQKRASKRRQGDRIQFWACFCERDEGVFCEEREGIYVGCGAWMSVWEWSHPLRVFPLVIMFFLATACHHCAEGKVALTSIGMQATDPKVG